MTTSPAAPMSPSPPKIARPEVVIYTDGACKGNPGRGGWGAWLKNGTHEKELFGGEA
ncbi:MAG: RNase H family protein, partial [Leptothrix ochracea]